MRRSQSGSLRRRGARVVQQHLPALANTDRELADLRRAQRRYPAVADQTLLERGGATSTSDRHLVRDREPEVAARMVAITTHGVFGRSERPRVGRDDRR